MAKLVLVRHGQSIWNLQNRFTGWVDVSLSKKGRDEAKAAAKLLENYSFDVAFTSTLIRAQETLHAILNGNQLLKDNGYCFVHDDNCTWYEHFDSKEKEINFLRAYTNSALNERYYGDLQGLNKEKTAEKYGEDKVHLWRRSFDIPPPNGESLEMTSKRTIPYFDKFIKPLLKKGKNILVVAHGNSLRSIVMHIEKMTPEEILKFEMATGTPHIYEFDNKLSIISKNIMHLK